MRKIMVASPLKGALPAFYYKNMLEFVMGKLDGIQLFYTLLEGPAVQVARNQIVQYARQQKCTELIQIDVDLDATPACLMRLLSHEHEKVVCGLYGKRESATNWHVAPWSKDEKPDANGLLRVHQSAIGFSKIRMSVFDELEKLNPDRCGRVQEAGASGQRLVEFFPMELMGPNTPLARTRKIRALLKSGKGEKELLASIQEALDYRDPVDNDYIGEDYGFCTLCREAGIPIHIDTHLMLKHAGTVKHPIETVELLSMLKEPWREDEVKKLTASYWPKDYISKDLAPNHCLDVLEGCYDVPIEGRNLTILDIGANVGAFARWAVNRWPDATIHSYEPYKGNYTLLLRTIKELIKSVRVIPHNQAVLDEHGVIPLYQVREGQNCGEYSLSKGMDGKSVGGVETVDSATLPEADLIKIDAEGAEARIIAHLKITDRLKAIVLEFHSQEQAEGITAYLLSKGFKPHSIQRDSEHRGIMKFIR